VGGGGYFGYSNGHFYGGTYVSGDAGVGVNVSAGVQIGGYGGGTENFFGKTYNVNAGTAAGGGTLTYDSSGNLVGGSISIGPSLAPISYSATTGVTGKVRGTTSACP